MDSWFRLRHLQSIMGINVNVSIKDLNCNSIFFALSTTDQENLGYFYKSSYCDNLLNPLWENIDLSYDNINRFSFLDNFIMTIFLFNKNKNKIILEIKIHLSGLVPISKLNSINTDEDSQSFLFQFNNSWYSYDFNSPQEYILPDKSEINVLKIKKKLYSLDTVQKFLLFINNESLKTLQIAQTKRDNLETQVHQKKLRICCINQKSNKILLIKSQILNLRKFQKLKTKELSEIKQSVTLLEQKIEKTIENHGKMDGDVSKQNNNLKLLRDIYLKVSNEYMLRVYQLIHELSKIFPIIPTDLVNSVNSEGPSNAMTIRSSDKFSICNLYLPNIDKFNALSFDNTMFAALGMVCQLLIALSKIYDVPLRYRLVIDDPKTAIRDDIIDIDETERNFLLVKSTAPSYRLSYAIYLLNLNITAIRGYFNLSTKSPDRTLWNINTLIEGKSRIQGSRSVDMGSSNNLVNSTQIHSSSPSNDSRSLLSPSPLVTQRSFTANN